jgi:hypothetical protein
VKILLRYLKISYVRQVPPSPGGDSERGSNCCFQTLAVGAFKANTNIQVINVASGSEKKL